MSDKNWERELAKIDKQLESVSDEALFPTKQVNVSPAVKQERVAAQASTKSWGAIARLALSVLLGVAILFWPYVNRCGVGLAAYLIAVVAVGVGGVWSAIWTWRHRAGAAHALSLLLVVWGLVLAAVEVLPRIGYAKPTLEHPPIWTCG
jgi:hypothetical protein